MLFDVRAAGGFVAGQVEIESQGVKSDHGELGAEGIEFAFGPATVQAHRAGDIFGEGLAKIALAEKDVADEASGVDVVNAAAGPAAGIG